MNHACNVFFDLTRKIELQFILFSAPCMLLQYYLLLWVLQNLASACIARLPTSLFLFITVRCVVDGTNTLSHFRLPILLEP
jgi:hypothetical protein